MLAKSLILHDGRLFYSVSAAAKLLGTSPAKLRKLEGLEWENFKANGKLWISAESVERRLKLQKV